MLFIILGIGFLIGILYENLSYEGYDATVSIFYKANLQQMLQMNHASVKYFLYILKERIAIFLPVCLIGFVRWKKTIVTLFVAWVGFLYGVFLSNAVIWHGWKGIVLGLSMLFPHFVFYAISYWIVLRNHYHFPQIKWDKKVVILVAGLFLLGTITEAYINPWIVKGVFN